MASESESGRVWPASMPRGSVHLDANSLGGGGGRGLSSSLFGRGSSSFAPLGDVADLPAEEEADLEATNAALAAAEANAAQCDPTDLPLSDANDAGVELAGRHISISQAGAVMRGDESVLSHRAAAAAAATAAALSAQSSNGAAGRESHDGGGGGQRTGSICVEGQPVLPYQSCATLRTHPSKDATNGWSVRFDWVRFIEEYLVHAVGILGYPYLRWKYTRAFADNHQLLNFFTGGWMGCWTWSAFVAVNVLQGIYGASGIVTFSEVLIASLVFLSRNSIIAAKYAYLSPIQVADRMARVIPREEMANQLLLQGWLHCPRQTQLEEIDHAFSRLGLVSSEKSYATFVGHSRGEVASALARCVPDQDVPPEHGQWRSEREKGRLHLRLIAQHIVGQSVASVRYPSLPRVALAAAVVHAFIPTFLRWHQGHPLFGSHWYDTCMIVFSLFISLPNFAAGLMFVLTGFVDYQRRVFLMHRCSALLVDPLLIADLQASEEQPQLPLLNFSKANNVGLWLELRQIFKDFGLQFFHRVQAYSSFWVFTVVVMLIFLFIQLLYQHTADPTGIFLVGYDLAVLTLALLVMLGAAKTLNKQHVEHRKILLKKLSDMQRHVSLLSKADSASHLFADSVVQAKKMVKVAIQVIETDDELAPVQIMGFDANANLVRALVTAAGSGLLAAGKLLAEER